MTIPSTITSIKHFSELSKDEVLGMWRACAQAAIDYADKINMGGLSGHPTHNIYEALEKALFTEWEKAKKLMKKQN